MNICTSSRKALRNIQKVNGRTHCDVVALLSDFCLLRSIKT